MVDLPAPFDPTIAMRESRPTSKLTRFKMILDESYPNVTSESWSKGGEIFSVSGNLNDREYEGIRTHAWEQAHTPEGLRFLCDWRSEFWKLHLSLKIRE